MRKLILLAPVIFIIGVIVIIQFDHNSNIKTAAPVSVIEDSLSDKLSSSLESVDSLKPLVNNIVNKIKYYEGLKTKYQEQEPILIYKKDTTELHSLRNKLVAANNEISRLNNELRVMAYREYPKKEPARMSYVSPAIITPDENSIVLSFEGTLPKEAKVYLIPYNRSVKRYMEYESSCDVSLSAYRSADNYNGLYFFNNVESGKYLIKVCTYYGNYKVIKKGTGKEIVSMQVSPPIQ